jgi:hypothetical protein
MSNDNETNGLQAEDVDLHNQHTIVNIEDGTTQNQKKLRRSIIENQKRITIKSSVFQ